MPPHDVDIRLAEPRRISSDAVIALSLDLRFTAADLAALAPEQIRALFVAVGTVQAIVQQAKEAAR